MLCPTCGATNADGAPTCAACGTPLPPPAAAPAEAAAPLPPAYTPAPTPVAPPTYAAAPTPPVAPPTYTPAPPVYSAATASPAASALIPNYLVPAILTTLFCCMPTGIVSIIFSSQVNTKLAAGDLQGATAASNTAKIWCIVGFCLGLVVWIIVALYVVLVVILGVAAAAQH